MASRPKIQAELGPSMYKAY